MRRERVWGGTDKKVVPAVLLLTLGMLSWIGAAKLITAINGHELRVMIVASGLIGIVGAAIGIIKLIGLTGLSMLLPSVSADLERINSGFSDFD